MSINLKTAADIEKMRQAGRLAAEVLQVVAPFVKPGVTTEELDRICHDHIVNVQGAIPANVGYRGYPKTVCTSVVDVTREAMFRGIRVVRPGATLGDIGHAIQEFVERERFSVVREYCGHGIGKVYHDDPQVLHYGRPGEGVVLKEGMTFTIEPMINLGTHDHDMWDDGWTVVTKDRRRSAQFEHTLLVTADGAEILTRLPGDDNDL